MDDWTLCIVCGHELQFHCVHHWLRCCPPRCSTGPERRFCPPQAPRPKRNEDGGLDEPEY